MPRGSNPALEVFLQLLYPWGPDHQQLFKSVTWSFTTPDNKAGMANYATQDYDKLIRLIETRGGRPATNTYVALGTQRMASFDKITADGYPRAIRRVNNVVSFKSIYLDLDVKPDAYATTDDAFAALDDFIATIGLPEPTMEVLSGTGGCHIYWCTKDPMPIDAWIPLSKALQQAAIGYGLKFDPAITVNAAGVLRAPGTWNYKRTPPTQVTLLEDSSFKTYGYQELVSALGSYVGPMTGVRLVAPAGGGSAGAYTSNFTDNVENAPPVAIDDVAVNCGVINDILARGGDGDSEPLWNLALYLASFTEDPRAAAHQLSSGDKRYTTAETDQKLNEKINARAGNPSAGWPQCTSFSPLHPACQTCPLFAQNKSPLNFARRPQIVQQVQQQIAAAHAANSDHLMPNGYWRRVTDKHVETTIIGDKGDPIVIDVLGYPVIDAGIDPDSGDLVLRTIVSGLERWGSAAVQSNLQPVPAAQALAKGAGIFVQPANFKTARDFLVAWMTRLQEAKRIIKPSSFGWTDDGKGFTFDDKTYTSGGPELAFRGSSIDNRFGASGGIAPWQDAMKLVYGNAPLEAAVASAFAAPLVSLIGSTSIVLSVFSHLSGVGKTTSLQLAQAVWGNPRTGMSSLDDTYNSVLKKVADLKSLPVYWDELRTMEQLEKTVNLVFSITQGKAKSRLTRDIVQAEAGSFTTMFVIASNYGLADTVYSNTDATEAGGLRVFEIEAEELPKGNIDDWQSRQMMLPLSTNYGVAGARYADYLARNRGVVAQALASVSADLASRFQFTAKERFWSMTMATILTGAALANHCGVASFNLPGLRAFMDAALARQRSMLKTQSHTTLAAPDSVLSLITDMQSELRSKNMIITDYIHYNTQPGRPQMVKLIDVDPSRLQEVWMQVGQLDGRIRARVKPFNQWLRDHRQHPGHVLKLLAGHYHILQSRQKIGAGVTFLDAAASLGRSECYDFTPLNGPGSIPGST